MEPADHEALDKPEEDVIHRGGSIFIAQFENEIVGTEALKFVETSVYEFSKMAVDESIMTKKWKTLSEIKGVTLK